MDTKKTKAMVLKCPQHSSRKNKRRLLGWGSLLCLSLAGKALALNYETKKFSASYENCAPIGYESSCTYTEWDYPIFTGGAPAQALHEINHQINNTLLTREENSPTVPDPKTYNAQLFAEYKKFREQFPDATHIHWYEIKTVEILLNTSKILSLSLSEESYLGGAHPNRQLTYWVFNPQTGKAYSLLDFFKPGSEAALLKKVEAAFRKQQGLSPQQDLTEAGYFFPDNRFVFPKNFAITSEGINFFYNTYEVAAYVVGPIDFTLSYRELSQLIPKQGILRQPLSLKTP